MLWGDKGHCPRCGRFCGRIRGTLNEVLGLVKVTGRCKIHGLQDLTDQEWSFDDFASEEDGASQKVAKKRGPAIAGPGSKKRKDRTGQDTGESRSCQSKRRIA